MNLKDIIGGVVQKYREGKRCVVTATGWELR